MMQSNLLGAPLKTTVFVVSDQRLRSRFISSNRWSFFVWCFMQILQGNVVVTYLLKLTWRSYLFRADYLELTSRSSFLITSCWQQIFQGDFLRTDFAEQIVQSRCVKAKISQHICPNQFLRSFCFQSLLHRKIAESNLLRANSYRRISLFCLWCITI